MNYVKKTSSDTYKKDREFFITSFYFLSDKNVQPKMQDYTGKYDHVE